MVRKVSMVIAAALVLLLLCGSSRYNDIRGTNDNDIRPKSGRTLPDCGNPLPCTHDIHGTAAADHIVGLSGWDWIRGGAGDDVIYGGDGMDQIYSDAGNDKVYGGKGHDHLFGDDGSDLLKAADGKDEQMHVEATYGDRAGKGSSGFDTCILDEDPRDGIVIGGCEKVVIKSVPGMDGKTPWGKTQEGVMEGSAVFGYVTPGTHFSLQ